MPISAGNLKLCGETAKFRGAEIAFGVNTSQSEISQYFGYLKNTLTGHFGVSLTFFPETVTQVVR